MRIQSVEAIPVSYPEPNDFDAIRHLCLAKLTADDGQVGWGEAITQFAEASWATKPIIEAFAPLIIGHDPVHTDRLWRAMRDHAWWYGYKGGIASYAVSAVDMALWDLKGKALGRSVLDLLGGPVHERLPGIASGHAHHEDISRMAEQIAGWVRSGLHGVKVGFGKRGHARLGFDHARDIAFVKAVREAIGEEKSIMIDLGWAVKWDVTTAVERTRAMEDFKIAWIEEPLGAWDPDGYATLKAKTTTRIAYGEKEWDLEGYERILDTGTVDVVGVDPGRAQGITGFRKVAERVEAHRRQANAHAWSSAIGTAASLAISFNSPACKVFEFKPLPNPMQHDLVKNPVMPAQGWAMPPAGPGLGIEVIEAVVDRYRSERVLAKV
jgi:L-alanine-DL-glutamate epimerase-like enolase superfamily enzyme